MWPRLSAARNWPNFPQRFAVAAETPQFSLAAFRVYAGSRLLTLLRVSHPLLIYLQFGLSRKKWECRATSSNSHWPSAVLRLRCTIRFHFTASLFFPGWEATRNFP